MKNLQAQLKDAPSWLLPLGALLLVATHFRFGIGFMAWVAYVPFLLYLKHTNSFLPRGLLYLALSIAWTLTTFKIITPPIPMAMAFGFGFLIASFHFLGFLAWDLLKKRRFGFLVFPAAMVIMEYIQHRFTPFASWGTAAYTQLDSIILLQAVSLFGMAGLGFVIYLVNVLLTQWINGAKPIRATMLTGLVLVGLMGYGHLRLGFGEGRSRELVTVATIGTDSRLTGWPVPSREERLLVQEGLYARTRKAAASGAKLIVWNEASTGVMPEEEPAFLDNLTSLAKECEAEIVACYVVPLTVEAGQFENKYIWARPDGSIHHTYFKHEPVPGEPAVKGSEPQQGVKTDYGILGGAICYDYDYPYLARGNARLGVDIVAVPSSDWRGIDPIHTQMAAVRGIEFGQSLVRSTRFGLSAAYDPYGRIQGRLSHFDSEEKIMVTQVPIRGVWTLYSVIGELFIFGCLILIGVVAFFDRKLS